MLASLLNQLFSAAVETLPRLFLLGAPLLVIAIILAALIDTRLPAKR